jgi:hypothetical protein
MFLLAATKVARGGKRKSKEVARAALSIDLQKP